MCQIQEFGFYLKCNADSLKDSTQECEKLGVCFRNLIFLVLCICHDKGQVVGRGTREEAIISIQVTEECSSLAKEHLPSADRCSVCWRWRRGQERLAASSRRASSGCGSDRMERVSRLERC